MFSLFQFWTRAAVPYGDIPSTDVRHFLESGRRLSQPIHCPDVLFELMISCWRSRPIDRPDFSQIGQRMREMLQVGKKPKFYLNFPIERRKAISSNWRWRQWILSLRSWGTKICRRQPIIFCYRTTHFPFSQLFHK